MSFYTPEELAAMDVVQFRVNDRGKTITFNTPIGAGLDVVCNDRPLEWKVTTGPGLDGATAKFTGLGLASGTITLTMGGTEEGPIHRQQYDAGVKKYIRGPARGQPAPIFDVIHAQFAEYEPPVKQIHFKGQGPGAWDKNTQIKTVVLNWEEHRNPSPTLSSPSTAGAGKDGAKAKNKTTEAYTKSIEQNMSQITELTQTLATTP
jgi:hypothetical protein